MHKYEVYLIKKTAHLKFIDAESSAHAEQIGYELLANESFENPSDPDWDRYVYVASNFEEERLNESR